MNVGDLIVKAAVRFPNHTVIVSGDVRLTTKALLDRMYRLANALVGLGLEKGDRVAVLMNNCSQSVECFYGLTFPGLVLVPMNSRYSAQEHLHMLNDSEARVILVGEEHREIIASIMPAAKTVKAVVCVTGKPLKGMLSYEDLLAKASSENPGIEVDGEDMLSLRYTAGTTGHPKGTHHTHRGSIVNITGMLIDGNLITEEDSIALTAPVTHVSGAMILPYMLRGAKVVILPGFDVGELMETIQKEKITAIYLVPTMLIMLLNHPDLKKYDLSSINTIRYGAAPIAPDVLKKAIEVFGNVFIQGYGLTEALNSCTILNKSDHILDGDEKKLKRLSSIGREAIVANVRIMDDQDRFLKAGEIGEIVIQSDQSMKGYWKNPEATAETIRHGWLHTRDVGYIDEDGYIYLVDRKGDMIITGGFNVYPREVEDVLYGHPAVLEAAVFGVPDDKWGEAVKAAVSLKTGMTVTEKEIIEYCGKSLAGFKKPKSVDFLENLPKSAAGKIVRRALKEPYWQAKTRKI